MYVVLAFSGEDCLPPDLFLALPQRLVADLRKKVHEELESVKELAPIIQETLSAWQLQLSRLPAPPRIGVGGILLSQKVKRGGTDPGGTGSGGQR